MLSKFLLMSVFYFLILITGLVSGYAMLIVRKHVGPCQHLSDFMCKYLLFKPILADVLFAFAIIFWVCCNIIKLNSRSPQENSTTRCCSWSVPMLGSVLTFIEAVSITTERVIICTTIERKTTLTCFEAEEKYINSAKPHFLGYPKVRFITWTVVYEVVVWLSMVWWLCLVAIEHMPVFKTPKESKHPHITTTTTTSEL